jgi:hypothetical protein
MEIDFSAHAYLVRTNAGLLPVVDLLSARGISTRGNPDCMVRECDELLVEDARAIALFASYKPVGDRKYVIVHAGSMNVHAQNALLKIVEEGSGHSVFFFILAPGVSVLPTLESRCVMIRQQTVDSNQQTAGSDFLSMSPNERLALAEKFGKDQDRMNARALVRSLLTLHESKKFTAIQLRDLLEADQYLKLSGSSPKGIIGHLALVL